jgi:hypothetical protein
MFLILFLLFIQPVFAQDYDKTLSELQFNQQAAEDDLINDPDAQVLERLRAKADKVQALKEQRQEILELKRQDEVKKEQELKAIEAIQIAEAKRVAEALLSNEAVAGTNWSDIETINP